jgi:ribosomal protein L37AE/L43A
VNRISVNQCAQCGADIIAAEWSEHLTDHCIRNVWSCDACGYQFEDTIYLAAREAADARLSAIQECVW